MELYPLKLKPYYKKTIWGGKRLSEKYGKKAEFNSIAETWELSCREKENCIIDNGSACGMTLSSYLKETGCSFAHFPLLIKFIDAYDKLSVQVHPDKDMAKYFGGNEKNELWYIVECGNDAEIIYGVKNGVTEIELKNAIQNEAAETLLHHIKVKPGEVYYIPSGQIHAIGKDILILEIQQNSDTTYRIDDYGRKRKLHIKEAIASVKIRNDDEIQMLRYSKGVLSDNCIANSNYFYSEIISIFTNSILPDRTSYYTLTCIEGSGEMIYNDKHFPVHPGDTYFIPFGLKDITTKGKMKLIYTSTC